MTINMYMWHDQWKGTLLQGALRFLIPVDLHQDIFLAKQLTEHTGHRSSQQYYRTSKQRSK